MNRKSLRAHWADLDKESLVDAQLGFLRHYLKNCVIPYSKYYGEQLASLDVDGLTSLADLAAVPLTSKEDLLATEEHPDRARELVLQPTAKQLQSSPANIARALFQGKASVRESLEKEFRPVLMTSTTGRSSDPVPFLYTHYDLDNLALCGTRMMEICQSKKEFRHLNAFPYAPHLAFWQMHYASLGFNTFCLSTGGGKTMGTEGNLHLIRKIKPDALIGMPTFVYHLLSCGLEDGLRWTNLQRIVLGGEKVPPGLRRKLRRLCADLGSEETIIMATYGFTEAKTAWPECAYPADAEPSGYHLYPDLGIVEIIDPETGEPVEDGQPGEIVYTPLDARGTVVIRYRTGDLIDGGLIYDPCPHCGRQSPRLTGRISRVSNRKSMQLDKFKGTLVDFNELEHLLDDEASVGSWQLELRKANDDPLDLDELIVHVTNEGALSEGEVRRKVENRFARATEIRPNRIVFHKPKRMRSMQGVGDQLKEERIIDRRPQNSPGTVLSS